MSEGLKLTLGLAILILGTLLCGVAFYMDQRKLLRVFLMGLGVAGFWVGRMILKQLT